MHLTVTIPGRRARSVWAQSSHHISLQPQFALISGNGDRHDAACSIYAVQAGRDPATRTRIPSGHLVPRTCTVGRCVAASAYTNWDVLRYTSPDLSSSLVSFASAEVARLRTFLQKKHADPNEPPVMLGEARDALPLWQTKKILIAVRRRCQRCWSH